MASSRIARYRSPGRSESVSCGAKHKRGDRKTPAQKPQRASSLLRSVLHADDDDSDDDDEFQGLPAAVIIDLLFRCASCKSTYRRHRRGDHAATSGVYPSTRGRAQTGPVASLV
ncbi:Crp/Fnr family transcriptional regulator [Anopheles sinensis]|uniref:Crp/Fnr family transcriptional regulator n=1 Tax=Anopheles sinensis TaxID=74873 RepID=A0A084W625_ANOSI|nr:Crp/Fnr family transcriptional regulator [Anopheles sinensis]